MNHHTHRTHERAWDETAEAYAQKAERLEPALRAATEAMLVAAHVGPGTRVLDLACGPGHSTATAQDRGAEALGLDLSAAAIARARLRFPTVPFMVGDMTRPPPGPWDAITCRFGAHHVDLAWLAAAFGALRPGGRLAIAEVVPAAAFHEGHGKVSAHEWGHRFEGTGFEEVTVQPCPIPRIEWPDTWIIAGRKPGIDLNRESGVSKQPRQMDLCQASGPASPF